jgi:hypothetical protein
MVLPVSPIFSGFKVCARELVAGKMIPAPRAHNKANRAMFIVLLPFSAALHNYRWTINAGLSDITGITFSQSTCAKPRDHQVESLNGKP